MAAVFYRYNYASSIIETFFFFAHYTIDIIVRFLNQARFFENIDRDQLKFYS